MTGRSPVTASGQAAGWIWGMLASCHNSGQTRE